MVCKDPPKLGKQNIVYQLYFKNKKQNKNPIVY